MPTVVSKPAPSQRRGGRGPDTTLLAGLVLVTCTAIGAILWIVLVSGPNVGAVAQAAIAAVSAVAVASISAFTLALRRRSRTGRS